MSDDLLPHFIVEGRELTQAAGEDLLALEGDPEGAGLIDGVFRAFHTLKGSAGLFDLPALSALLQDAETLLGALRDGAQPMSRAVASALLDAVGETERWLDALESDGPPPASLATAAAALQVRLEALSGDSPPAVPGPPASDGAWVAALLSSAPAGAQARTAIRYVPTAEAYFRGDDPIAILQATPGLIHIAIAPRTDFGALTDYAPFDCNLELTALSTASAEETRAALRFVNDQVEVAGLAARAAAVAIEASPSGRSLRTLRVDAALVDDLAALVDELVIAKNALAHQTGLIVTGGEAPVAGRGLVSAQATLERAVGRLHASVTRVRMVPLAQLFSRFPRLVRDLADGLGKKAELVVSGEDVAVDKAIVDGLFEPLLHLVRNAVDHGVETPAARQTAGKPAAATLTLSAHAQGDEVLIELRDDGAGLDGERIREVAVLRGVVTGEDAERLTDPETFELIFAPGFSTASTVSDVSGRGVGMDVVRRTVAGLGGRVRVDSRRGEGASIHLALPLRVVLARVMVVNVGDERFAAPLDDIAETVRVRREAVTGIRAGRAFLLRDEVVPLMSLGELLGGAARDGGETLTVLVVGGAERRVGVVVDGLGERLEAPLRPMSGLLAGAAGMRGTILQGDGGVLMVLDLAELTA
ncbi:chemotaxis protein CheA [Phenylobacterium sp.]|uniref:chemotaxis protein CheA n=1 Tax=Phenylobacterium sp. TaxID=1871053 RepID=UPI0027348F82|nr:chemotaxis protein CheA [Phenylobacterium sp.]MDP3660353.1 chemotaxis protein CheA [Phenylobacterium sp.]